MKSTREKKERRKYKDSKLYMQKARYVDEIDRKIGEEVVALRFSFLSQQVLFPSDIVKSEE